MHSWEKADGELLRIIGQSMDEAARLAGPHLVCRPGCIECCIGPFLITPLDAWRLRRGLDDLSRTEPARAAQVRERARAAAELMRPHFDLAREEEFAERFAAVPCPALDSDTGRSDLYEWRPVACRTFGPPVRFAADSPPPCRLCFTGAAPHEIERCRVDVDRDRMEEMLLAETSEPETIIAFAIDAVSESPGK